MMTEISLDSQKDVQFLKSNISLAAREKLDTHLPPSAVPNIHSDSLRKRVEEMLDEYVNRTFEMASSSLLINGMKPSLASSTEQQDIEPFDADLLARVQSLHQEIEQQILNITSARRSKPLEAASIIQQSYSNTVDIPPLAEITVDSTASAPSIAIPRGDEIKETFTNGMKVLKDLKKFVPATSAKVERAKDVVNNVYS